MHQYEATVRTRRMREWKKEKGERLKATDAMDRFEDYGDDIHVVTDLDELDALGGQPWL